MSQTATLPISTMLPREARSRTTTSSSWQDVIATSPSQASTSSTSLKSIDALASHSSPSSPGILSLSSADVTNSRRPSLAPPIGLDVVIDEEHLNPKRPMLVSTPPSPTSSSGGSSTSSKRNASSAFASPTTSSAKRQRLPSIEIGFGPEPPSPFSSPPAAPRSKFSSSSSSTSPSDPKRAYFQNLVKDIGARGYSTMGAQDREQLLMAKLASHFADFTAQIEAGQQRERELRSRAMVVLGQRDHARAKLAEAEERLEVERRGASGSGGSRSRHYQQTAPGGMTPLGMVTTAMKSQHQQQWLPPRSLSASSLHGLP